MEFEIFTSPEMAPEISKFLRVREVIYLGPVDGGHADIADHFNIYGEVQRLKKVSRKDVDGGHMEVNNTNPPFSVQFDNASGTFDLDFYREAREGTIFVARPKCPDHLVFYEGLEENGITEAKTVVQKLDPIDLYDQEGYSFYSIR